MSSFNPAFGGFGYDHASRRNLPPGNLFDLRPAFGQSGNHYRSGPGGFSGGIAVPGYGQTSTYGYPMGCSYSFRYTCPFSSNAGTCAPVFGHSSQPFGFIPDNGATYATPIGCGTCADTFGQSCGGTSVPTTFGQNSSTPFGPANGGTSMPAFGQNSARFGSLPANGGTSMPAFGQNSTPPFGFNPSSGKTNISAFGQNSSTPFGSVPANGGTSVPAFGQNSATPFRSLPANGGTSMPAFGKNSASPFNPSSGETNVSAFGQNCATLGSAPANVGAFLPAFGQSYTPGRARANGGTSVPAFGRSTNPFGFGFTTSNTTTSVSAWQRGNPLGPVTTNGATFASGAPLFSTLTQATPLPPIGGFLSGSTTHFPTPTINASSFPGFGFGCTTSGHTTTQFGTIGNSNETSTCSDEIQSPFSGFQVKTPLFGDSSSGPLTFGVSRGGSRVTPYTETVEMEPFSQQSARFMSISAMPAFRDKCHEELRWEDKQLGENGMLVYQDKSYEELRWEDHQFNNAGGGVGPDSAQLNCFKNPVSRTGSSFQNAMPSSAPPNIFAFKPPCFTFPACTTPFTSNSLLNDSCEVAYTSIAQPPSFGPTITFSQPNPSIISASAGKAFKSGPSFLNYTSAPCASICSTSVTTPVTASVPCNIPPSISTLHDASPSRCRAETPPAVPQMSAEDPKTTSVRYGISGTPVNQAYEKEKLLQPPTCNRKGDGPKVTFCAGAHETPTARTKNPLLTKDNLGISITGLSEEWTLKIDFENMSHIKHTSIHVYEDGKVSVELSKPLADGLMYQDKAGNPCETFAAEHSLRTNSIDCNHISEKEVPSNVYGLMPKLKHSDYFIEPRVEELAIKESSEPGFCSHVKDFVVGHQRYGRIKFFGETDVRQLDVNSQIMFGNGEVILSMDENKKPPVGQGLNKPAEITLRNIKCVDKAGNQHISGPKVDKYKEKLKKKTAEQGAEFVSYDPVQGEWKFRVEHF